MASDGSQSKHIPSVVHFDEDGDTRLLLTRCGHEHTYVVSSKVMSLVCSAWKSMLSLKNGFREATLGDNRVIPLPDDDPEALRIVLNIAHMHFDLTPKVLRFKTLLGVAELAEKYGTIRILRPWIKEWLKAVEHLVEKPGYEEWLFIAWAFGETAIFETITHFLLRHISVNEHGQYVTPEGKVLDPSSDTYLFPPGAIDFIIMQRRAALTLYLELVYERVDEYLEISTDGAVYGCRNAHVVSPDVAETCDALTFGGLVLALSRIGLGPQRKEATDITESLDTICNRLQTISLRHLGYSPARTESCICDHSICTAVSDIQAKAELLPVVRFPILDSHHNHMKQKQAELNGIVRKVDPVDQPSSGPHKKNSRKRRRNRPQ